MLYNRLVAGDASLVGRKLAAVSFVAAVSSPILSSHFSRDAFCGGVPYIPLPTRERLPTDFRFSDVLSKL